VLLIPTWSQELEKRGLLMASRWHDVYNELSKDYDILLSPHPLIDRNSLDCFATKVKCTVLEGRGCSFSHVPDVHCTVCDLSGSFWEALLFDTPAILVDAKPTWDWADDLRPSRQELERVVPVVTPNQLAVAVRDRVGQRQGQQHKLASHRLGDIDGNATERLATRISAILAEKSKVSDWIKCKVG
jgi:hypothetical protein